MINYIINVYFKHKINVKASQSLNTGIFKTNLSIRLIISILQIVITRVIASI